MPGLTIRETTIEDVDFLWEMLFYASHSYEEPDATPAGIRSNPDLVPYIDGWVDGGLVGVIAEHEAPRGAAWLRAMKDTDRSNPVFVDRETPELAIAVVPGFEGEGVGTAMMRRLLEIADGKFDRIVLSVREGNGAVKLYQRFGFEDAGTMVNRVGTRSSKMLLDLHRPRAEIDDSRRAG